MERAPGVKAGRRNEVATGTVLKQGFFVGDAAGTKKGVAMRSPQAEFYSLIFCQTSETVEQFRAKTARSSVRAGTA